MTRPLSPIAMLPLTPRQPWRPAVPDPRTVDGVPVKLGDRVWFWRGYGNPRLRALDKVDLGMWWTSMTSKRIYSTEQLALEAAIVAEKRTLKKARQEVRRSSGSIERHKARLRQLGEGLQT